MRVSVGVDVAVGIDVKVGTNVNVDDGVTDDEAAVKFAAAVIEEEKLAIDVRSPSDDKMSSFVAVPSGPTRVPIKSKG